VFVSSLKIQNLKAFKDSGEFALDRRMNIITGHNNTGKSIILKALYTMQYLGVDPSDFRIDSRFADIYITLDDVDEAALLRHFSIDYLIPTLEDDKHSLIIKIQHTKSYQGNNIVGTGTNYNMLGIQGGASVIPPNKGLQNIPRETPNNFIYPYFSKRKATSFNKSIDRRIATTVTESLNDLVNKVDFLTLGNLPIQQEFRKLCSQILGFPLDVFPVEGGKSIGLSIDLYRNIPIEAMGDGVPHIVGLIANLCMAQNQLFLIEEIENDIHPEALKNLLNLIIEKSETNQFVVTTHSDIVMRYLGAIPGSKIYQISLLPLDEENIPTARWELIGGSVKERRILLDHLGYDLSDAWQWAGWLFLEESTAEMFINHLLIPYFIPNLKYKLRTISADGNSQVEVKFNDFYRLFLFVHLSSIYESKAWVYLDNDDEGKKIAEALREKFKTWNPDHFSTFSKKSFEEYYPEYFHEGVERVLALPHGQNKQKEKGKLVENVLKWARENEGAAKEAIAKSAAEIIDILKRIEAVISR